MHNHAETCKYAMACIHLGAQAMQSYAFNVYAMQIFLCICVCVYALFMAPFGKSIEFALSHLLFPIEFLSFYWH